MKCRIPNQLLTSLASRVLPLLILVAITGNLVPLKLAGSWTEVINNLQAGMTLSLKDPPLSMLAERLMIFLPLGLLMHWVLIRRRWRYPCAASLAFIILLALVIEVAQAAVSVRHALLLDFLVAVGAGSVGVMLIVRVGQGHAVLHPMRFLVLGTLIILGIIAFDHGSAKISGWDCNYPLLVGNELTQDRPWQGRIRGLAIYPRELTGEEVRQLAHIPMTPENSNLRSEAGAISLYHFATVAGNQAPQLAPGRQPLDLLIPKDSQAVQLNGDMLDIQDPALIHSTGPAEQICHAILTSQAFTVETEAASSDLRQGGPARIISVSVDPGLRNFTLGEEKGKLVFRVRTPHNGVNGSNIRFLTEKKVLTGGWHHIVASYARGTGKLYIDGAMARPPLKMYGKLTLGGKWSVSIPLIGGVLLFAMGIVAATGLAGRRWPKSLLLGLGATALVPLAFSMILTETATWSVSARLISGVLLFAMGIVAATGLAGRRWPKSLLLSLGVTALVPLAFSIALTVWLGHGLHEAFIAAVLGGTFLGLAVGGFCVGLKEQQA